MRIQWMRALTAAAVLGVPALAMAQLAAAREQTFRERDTNHDGVLTQEEYGGHPGNFRAMDANGDRVLSLSEFVNRYRDDNADDAVQIPAPPVQVAPDAFAAMDRNRNGRIDRDEWRSDMAGASFARMDRNHDGVVMRDEFMNPMPVGSREARFGEMDVNNNGYVNRSEWRDAVAFDVVDRNRDNRVTIDEYLDRRYGNGYGTGSLATRFAQLDRNRNGVINRGEWRGERLSFDVVDRDGDNRITEDEYVNQGTDGYVYEYGRANGRGSGMEARFAQMDRNRDGIVSRGEWRDSTTFRQVDRNNDGVVTLREYLNAPVVYETPSGDDRYGRATQFQALDRNGNGYIERREWTSDLTAFDRMDRNGDGRLSTSEYDSLRGTDPGSYETFRRLDDNGDGVVSRREWNGTAQAFADYDRNRDGVISRDEFLNYSNY